MVNTKLLFKDICRALKGAYKVLRLEKDHMICAIDKIIVQLKRIYVFINY